MISRRLTLNLKNRLLQHGQDVLSPEQIEYIMKTGKLTWII